MKTPESGDFEINFYEGVVKERPDYVDALIPLAEAYTRKKLYKKGLKVDLRLSQLCKKDPVVHYNLACSYALLGEKEKAIKALQSAVRFGYDDLGHLKKDPDLQSLQEDPAFKAFLKNISS